MGGVRIPPHNIFLILKPKKAEIYFSWNAKMPIYSFHCEYCGSTKEDLRKVEDYTPPTCSICGKTMSRIFTPVTAILKGQGWSKGTYEKIRRRSEQQGNKFFEKHPDKRELVHEKINENRRLE